MTEGLDDFSRDLKALYSAWKNQSSTAPPPPYRTNVMQFSAYGGPPLSYPGYGSRPSYPVYGWDSSLPPNQYPMALPMPPQDGADAQAAGITASCTEHLLAILRAHPLFQQFRRKSRLLLSVYYEVYQKNPWVLLLLRQHWDGFERLVRGLTIEDDHLPPLVVAGTSPLESSLGEDIERAPSTSVTPRISQLQSEPHIPHTGLASASVPESVEPCGAPNAKETELRRSKRPNDQKVKKIKLDKKVEETKTECKICMDEEVRVAFLPCGHLVSCPRCAERISNCPMCRKQITGKVRIYMS